MLHFFPCHNLTWKGGNADVIMMGARQGLIGGILFKIGG
jgi:hypothetical protein